MKNLLIILISCSAFFFATHLFAQVKTVRPLAEKTVVTTTATKPIENPKPAKTENPPPKPTDLQNAVINIVVGNDGKDNDTKLAIVIGDENKRTAGYYGVPSHDLAGNAVINGTTMGEYFPGDNETVPITLEASIPTGQVTMKGSLPLPVLREAEVSDFNGGGGTVQITIMPNGHDKWNINSFTLTLYFNNDPGSPHRITWNGFTVAQDSPSRILEFDKNFNPIQ
jgi:hypothetical protein